MKTIKNILKLLSIVFIMTAFSNCAGAKKLQKEVPFTMGTCSYQKWVAGVKGGGSGVNVTIPVNNMPEEMALDSIYFRGMKAPLVKAATKKGTLYIARFKTPLNAKKDMISHADPKKEVGNKPTILPEKIPFELAENEAVISYISKGKKRYYKLTGLKPEAEVAYPSAPVKKGF